MKKFLSVILASLIITAAGCSGNEAAETTTTTAAETTTTAAETTTEATTTEAVTTEADTAAEVETTPAETEAQVDNPFMTEEVKEFLDTVRAEAPIYADFFEKTSTIPLTMTVSTEVDVYGTGELTETTMDVGMASFESFYVSTVVDGVATDIILTDGKYYIVSHAEKTALYMEMSEEEALMLSESATGSVTVSFDASAATYESGETEFEGETYLYEKITTDEMGEIVIYADTATKEVKYFTSQGTTMKFLALSNTVDESKLEIPADYTLMDMSSLMG